MTALVRRSPRDPMNLVTTNQLRFQFPLLVKETVGDDLPRKDSVVCSTFIWTRTSITAQSGSIAICRELLTLENSRNVMPLLTTT